MQTPQNQSDKSIAGELIEIPKAYIPTEHEPTISALWKDANAFAATGDSTKEPFSIIMPPPNANGSLHAGHLMYVVEDIATRFARMQGRPTLWLPGTDHAGIETQVVYERILEAKGQTRFDLGPEKFYTEVEEFVLGQQDTIISQMQSMGFSADWSKLKFTLDKDVIETVYDTFERLLTDGQIYRGNRIVNWCSRCQAAFPDIETERTDREDAMYTLDYGSIQIATTRPETIFADAAVAVNSTDERYTKLVGSTATVPLLDRMIPIIADDHVSIKDGTGALKVTPAHDMADYDIGQRHNLPEVSVVDYEGKLINVPEEFAGLTVEDGRIAVVAALEKAGKLISTTPLTHAVAIHDRCKTVIEPLISEQWFMRVAQLNKPVIEAISSDEVTFYPSRFKKVALNWLQNEHDWCISRPGWWGIRIPIAYKTSTDSDKDMYIVARSEAEAEKYYGAGNYRLETDTFDTWFSSSQWPYTTLMSTDDFEQFYPTTMMASARDILHKWITRMIMFGIYTTGKVPFENVYLWGMVIDEKGQKLSKSKGNYDDPMLITKEFGTDALRLALSIGITPGNDGKISLDKIKGYRNFCNKVWNVARFTLSRLPDGFTPDEIELKTPADHWIMTQINEAITQVTKNIEKYRYSDAGQSVYSLLWDDLADKYIEYSKSELNPAVLAYGLDTILRLLHPFAPFVSETIWQELPYTDSLLITEQWPKVIHKPSTESAKLFELQIIEVLAEKQKEAGKVMIVKLGKEIALKKNMIKLIDAKLSNASFIQNAPAQLVEGERTKLATTHSEVKNLEAELEKLKSQ
ncbi:valine--tRNA ligase [Candidatus Saccharibacteria bacterium]|nr:valine--tRNA ligase [Candidatus Saccharibacteria bacterium]